MNPASFKISAQPAQTEFIRARLDRNMTVNIEPFRRAVSHFDLTGFAILDFGCGTGNLLRLLKNSKADIVYAFEVMPEHIAPDIIAWSKNPDAKPRLVINPPAFKLDSSLPDGDLTNYDYFQMLKPHAEFGIIGNPPYFLYNRVLSLTGTNLAKGDEKFSAFKEKFAGALMITSRGRLFNHPGWEIIGVMNARDFDPPAGNDQYIVQTGFRQTFNRKARFIHETAPPQKYIGINNRVAAADESDNYPEMWQQLDALRPN